MLKIHQIKTFNVGLNIFNLCLVKASWSLYEIFSSHTLIVSLVEDILDYLDWDVLDLVSRTHQVIGRDVSNPPWLRSIKPFIGKKRKKFEKYSYP